MTLSRPDTPSAISDSRYRRILFFFAGVIAHLIAWDIIGGRLPLVRNWVRRTRPGRFRQRARRFRALAVEMGGVLIKLGQFLSARVDVLPPEITEELQGLQDEVPPEEPGHMMAVLRSELGDLSAHFACVETEPLAAASLGQAHRAWLLPPAAAAGQGEAVVVKVQRPHIERIVATDLAALRVVARWTMRYGPIRRRANVPALMEEFAHTLWEELDYELEADNAERFARMYADDDRVYIPAVYRQHSTARVIVLENVEAIKIIDVEGMIAAGIEPEAVAERLLDVYFQQMVKEAFFHADPHPGNLFVRPRPDLPWQPGDGPRPYWLIFVDFGMVGRVPELVGENMRKLLVGVTQRDARQLTEAYHELGFFLPGADLERIAEVQHVLLDRIYGRNLLELSRPDPKEMQELSRQFRDLLFDFPFQIPQDFIYLGRAIGMTSGLVTRLHPTINPWYFFEKFGRELIREREGQDFSVETVLDLVRPYLSTPARLQRILTAAERGQLRVQTTADRETLRRIDRLEKRLSQLSWSIVGAAGIVSATLLYLLRKTDKD